MAVSRTRLNAGTTRAQKDTKDHMATVLINLNGTLIPELNTERLFYGFMERRHMVRARHRQHQIWFNFRWFPTYGKDVKLYNKAWLGGMRRADVDVFAEGFAKRKLIELIRPEMWQVIDHHRAKGDTLVLVSKTPDFIVHQLAKTMDIPHSIGTRCAYLGNLYLTDPPIKLIHGETKLAAVEDLLRTLGSNLENTTCYAHHLSDQVLLEAVGNPVVVAPGKGLRRQAEQQNWEILDVSH